MGGKRLALAVDCIEADTAELAVDRVEAKVNGVKENLFSKEQLLGAERFSGKRDILNALLAEGEMYSVSAAEGIVEKFMKGQVR